MVRALILRVLLAGLLLGAYVYAWRPYGRTVAAQSVAAPILRAVTETSPEGWTVHIRSGGRRLTLRSPSRSQSLGWTAPAGVRFLLPALGVILVAPRRLYWLGLWGGHLVLGALGLALLGLEIVAGGPWLVLYDALTQYVVDAFSLGVAALVVAVEWNPDPPAPPDPE